ncbi:hypothetical protein AUQ37_03605 [Candidatus Methanomethylophilus sp. 1R26]|uniref:carbonic anhydrase n=1 Tax=Candidatus Methanomethylophilus sp. 1R26 TaxID=1769296 RepID=UPI00073728B4|nr:carbonic anhydrase [Candidatus Methanomethylophilus sp. 1R26]KUE73192.1 hypothetical protein AUQ37_03605 [Candidatus Methanomethylophilus sp. 1R26]
MDAESALRRLMEGNARYVGGRSSGDFSGRRRRELAEGQAPFAVVIACSDSRVVPEAVFSAGLGDIFVIRTAGNTAGPDVLASAWYAADHLRVPLIVVLGHIGCGAVSAALQGHGGGPMGDTVRRISANIGGERDPIIAAEINARRTAEAVREAVPGTAVAAAVYDTAGGGVRFLLQDDAKPL